MVSQTKSRNIPTRKILPLFFVLLIRYLGTAFDTGNGISEAERADELAKGMASIRAAL